MKNTSSPRPAYSAHGREFRFNDHICIEMLIGIPDGERTGRLVQVRIGCGKFGTDIYLVRLRDGTLRSFENAMIRHVDDRNFEDAFYRSNNRMPPVIPDQMPDDSDTENAEYTIADKYPEIGFVVEKPTQPQTPGFFTVTVMRGAITNE